MNLWQVEQNTYLQAISRSKLKVAVGLLTGHTTLRYPIFNLGLKQRPDCRLCGDEKEDSVHIVYHCPTPVCKRYKTLGRMFLKPEDLDNIRVSLVANIRHSLLVPSKIVRRYNGTTKIYVALGNIMEPLDYFTTTTTTIIIIIIISTTTRRCVVFSS